MPRSCLLSTSCAVALAMLATNSAVHAGTCTEPFGACCFDDGTCAELALSDCVVLGGVHQGRDSACAAATSCVGACCRVDTGCELLDANDCAALAGFWHGPGSACGDLPCGFGACCIGDSEGTCVVLGASECALTGGIHFGDGTDCQDASCAASRTVERFRFDSITTISVDPFDTAGGTRELIAVRVLVIHHSGVLAELENVSDVPGAGVFLELVSEPDVRLRSIILNSSSEFVADAPPLAAADELPCSGPDFHNFGWARQSTWAAALRTDPIELASFRGPDPIPTTLNSTGGVFVFSPVDYTLSFLLGPVQTDLRVAYLYRSITPCPEDIDGSGSVDFGDVVAVLSAWGACVQCPEDLDLNGTVSFNDLLLVLSAWGDCPA